MRNYEGVFIFRPTLEDEVRNEMVDRFKAIIEADGTVNNVDEWGMRKLAYEIDDIGEGYYILIEFEAGTEVNPELDRICKISDNLLRHMLVKAK